MKKKVIILVILLGILGLIGYGIFSYKDYSEAKGIESISVKEGRMYPEYSEDVTEYSVYTDKSEVTINCKTVKATDGCGEKVTVNDNVTNYEITTTKGGKEVTYVIKIVKQENDESKILNIESIEGNPTEWTKEAELEVKVTNEEKIEGVMYSFDGGATWSESNKKKLNKNGILKIVAKDYFGYKTKEKVVEVTKIDNDEPTVVISKKKINSKKVELTALAVDETSKVVSYSWNNGDYLKDDALEVSREGKYTVVVQDEAGNKSKQATVQVEFDSENNNSDDNKKENKTGNETREFVAIFDSNGSKKIGSKVLSCTTKGESCTINAPSIERDGYKVLGWSSKKDATIAELGAGSTITLKDNARYYAVTKKEVEVTFELNGAEKIGAISKSCTIYNTQTGCSIDSPTISRTNYVVVGWNKNKSAKSAEVKQKEKLVVVKDTKYYAITYNKFDIRFEKNGAGGIDNGVVGCIKYNTEEKCNVTLPKINAASGFSVVGWSSNKGATTKQYSQLEKITPTSSTTYYAITKSTNAYKATFNKNGVSSIGYESRECYRYNGAQSCVVDTPSIVASNGFKVVGWSDGANSIKKVAGVGEKIKLTKNTTYYALTKSNDYLTVKFEKNGSSSIENSSLNCYRYNGSNICSILLPKITAASGFSVIGWGSSAASTSAVGNPGQQISLSKNTTYYAITKSINPYTATFEKNGSSNVGSSSLGCHRYNGAKNCSITMPKITPASGFNVVGWSNVKDSLVSGATVGQKVNLTSSIKYYAITKSTNYSTIKFEKNGSSSIGNNSLNCYRYNGSSECKLTLPKITAKSGFSVIGWSKNKNATSKEASVGQTINANANTTYYAITKSTSPYKATFWGRGGATVANLSSGYGFVASCYLYNANTTCNVTTPTVKLKSGQEFKGWSTSDTATYSPTQQNEVISLKATSTYYAIIKQNVEIKFDKNQASSLSTYKTSCLSYGKGCKIAEAPVITKPGYEIGGFSTNKNAEWGTVLDRNYSENTTLYAIAKNHYRKKPLSVATTYKIGNMTMEIEKSSGLSYNVYKTYYDHVKKVQSKMPWLYKSPGKINMMSNGTFSSIWGNGWAGMAYGIGEYRSNDVSLGSSVSEYSKGTFIHEQGHVFDSYYGIKTGTGISGQTDVKNLYNKYSKWSSSSRPLRDYAYTNVGEFVAESIEYYYYYKYTNQKCPNGGNQITSDIIKVFEKYFDVAKKW